MNSAWRVSHDPLRLTEVAGALTSFEKEAREHGEDLMQWERIDAMKKEILDLGWYQDHYAVVHLAAENWDAPIQKVECRDLDSAVAALRRLAV